MAGGVWPEGRWPSLLWTVMSVNPQACLPADDPSDGHWFEGLADHLGAAYLRYSFTKGTVREVDSVSYTHLDVYKRQPSTRAT